MLPKAKIYRPAKTAMQSGTFKTRKWVFEYAPNVPKRPDALMGWSTGGTLEQIRLQFDTQEEAIAYAEKKGVPYEVLEPKERKREPKAYAANFANERILPF